MSEPVFTLIMNLLLGLVLGGVLGSFITMLTYRVPRGKSILTPRSACPSCRKTIPWKDLVPVVSYLRLKGACSSCKKPFGKKYFVIEGVSTLIVALLLVMYGFTGKGAMLIAIFAVLFSLGIIVYQQGREKIKAEKDD